MLTDTSRWSHTRGNEMVPSRWQATLNLWNDSFRTALEAFEASPAGSRG